MNRRLYRCYHDRKIAGVASGLAEYFDVDPTIIRVLWVLSIFFGGVGLLVYIAMAIIVPMEPDEAVAAVPDTTAGETTGDAPVPSPSGWHAAPVPHRHTSRGSGRTGMFVGIVLILFGALALIDAFLPAWVDGRFLWPAFIVGIGALLVVTAVRREPNES